MSAYLYSIGDIMDVAAAKVAIEGWQGVKWEKVGDDSVVEGWVPDGLYSKGPRKGTPRFSKPLAGTSKRVVVTDSEMQKHAAEYEASNQKCWDCKGEGQVQTGWCSKDGAKYGACKRCSESGSPE